MSPSIHTDDFSLISTHQENVSHDFEEHVSGKFTDSDTVIATAIRAHYPDMTLTTVPASNCGLLEYAAAGYARAELDTEDETVIRWRVFLQGPRRGVQGALASAEFFAKYKYTWMNEDFIVYYVSVAYIRNYYILRKVDEGETALSNSRITDALLRVIGEHQFALHNEILVYDSYWTKNSGLWEEVQKTSWKDVILDEKMKVTLTQTISKFFDDEKTYKDLEVPWKRGLIFHGPPGNGKTLSLRALMHSLSTRPVPIPSLYVKSMTYAYEIRDVFVKARQMAPCLLILEDIDSLVAKNLTSYFFNEVDGLESNDGIMLLATTNHLERLDPGLTKRPSRFDRKYKFPMPSKSERVLYCEFWRQKLRNNKSIDFPKRLGPAIAGITDGFSFAYMKEAFVATLLAIAGNDDDDEKQSDKHHDDDDDLDDIVLWKEMKKQIQLLREDMDSRRTEYVVEGTVEDEHESKAPNQLTARKQAKEVPLRNSDLHLPRPTKAQLSKETTFSEWRQREYRDHEKR